jgi:ABC-type spermidine/putrescine transport system permease subunit II
MRDFVDRRTAVWALLSVFLGIALFVGLELREEPQMSVLDLALQLVETVPLVLTSVGIVLLFLATRRQREEQLTLLRDLEVALSC